jgi:hypothetical protein
LARRRLLEPRVPVTNDLAFSTCDALPESGGGGGMAFGGGEADAGRSYTCPSTDVTFSPTSPGTEPGTEPGNEPGTSRTGDSRLGSAPPRLAPIPSSAIPGIGCELEYGS